MTTHMLSRETENAICRLIDQELENSIEDKIKVYLENVDAYPQGSADRFLDLLAENIGDEHAVAWIFTLLELAQNRGMVVGKAYRGSRVIGKLPAPFVEGITAAIWLQDDTKLIWRGENTKGDD